MKCFFLINYYEFDFGFAKIKYEIEKFAQLAWI